MAKYLFKVTYSTHGTKGLLADGGSNRVAAVEKMVEGLGGRVEAFYYAFGENDAFTIVDVPDAVSAAAVSLVVNATGAVRLSTTVLMTPEDMDAAAEKSVDYLPPGA